MPLLLITGLLLAGTAVALVGRAAALPRIRTSERLAAIEAYGFTAQASTLAAPPVAEPRPLEALAGRVGSLAARRFPRAQPETIGIELVRAGLYETTPETFLGYRALATLATLFLGLWVAASGAVPAALGLLMLAVLTAIGWYLPLVMLRTRGERRIAQIEYDLPELVDVLVVTVEAGLAFNSSLQLAARKLRGPLADELALTLQEQRMGLPINQALANMLERADTVSMRSFVRSILQGETLGVSIGDIMRALAHDTRIRRRQMAEERAQKAPIKILFPLIFLIFPAMFIVLLYPAVSQILKTLGG